MSNARPSLVSLPEAELSSIEFRVTRRRADLAAEAQRLARRRTVALAVAAKCRDSARPIKPEVAEAVSSRAARRASILHFRFHRVLDSLVDAGGFDDAMRIVRARGTKS
jgi:hypothetical protein